jgi:hypothetical protein
VRPAPRAAALLAALCLASARPAQAQDHDAMLRRGVELRRQGDDEAALAAFTAAYAAIPDARAAAQLATTHQALGHWVDADRLLGEALAAASDPWIVRNRAALAAAAAEIARHLGSLDVVGDTVGAEVLLDGRAVGRLPLAAPLRVNAGVVTVTLRAPGRSSAARRVVVEPGERAREAFDALAPEPSAPAPPPVVAPTPPSVAAPTPPLAQVVFRTELRRDPVPTVLAGFGGAMVSLGLAALVARELVAATYNSACPSAGRAPCDGLSAQADGWTVTAGVAIPLGVAALGVGVWRALAR